MRSHKKNWFAGCVTVAEIKKRYRKLAKQHHPDINHEEEAYA